MNDTTYIYGLSCPEGELRYIGKADKPAKRFDEHLRDARYSDSHRTRWLKDLIRRGLAPKLEILAEVPQEHWQEVEKDFIKSWREIGARLVNGTEGGDGTVGYKHSAESRAKNRAARLGKKQSAESNRKRSEKCRLFRHTPEAIEKIRIAHTGRKRSPETLAKYRAAQLGKKASKETKQKMRLAHRGPKNHEFGKKHPDASSQFRGVNFSKKAGKWEANFSIGAKRTFLGYFCCEYAAAQARDEKARAARISERLMNFPFFALRDDA